MKSLSAVGDTEKSSWAIEALLCLEVEQTLQYQFVNGFNPATVSGTWTTNDHAHPSETKNTLN